MSSNSSTVFDEDGDAADWIEVYNFGKGAISLDNFRLSDDPGQPFKWTFPDTTIYPGDYLLIWASGKNVSENDKQIHTNFSISAVGESLLLLNNEGEIVDQSEIPPLQTNISIGRKPDGVGGWVLFDEPTPGRSNDTESFNALLDPPIFSHSAGYYPGGLKLELTHPTEGVNIYYTTDGAEPTSKSALFTGEINLFGDRKNELMYIQTAPDEGEEREYGWNMPVDNIAGASVIRAKAYKQGYISSEIATRTFLHRDTKHNLPVISISTDKENLFSEDRGIYVPGLIYKELGWPRNDYWGRPNANYHQRGVEWERDSNFELIDDKEYLSQQIGLRIHGGGSRALPQKSLRLYARNELGDSHFFYDLFNDGEKGYNRLILRNSGQDFYSSATMFMDAYAQHLVSDLTFDTQKYRPFSIYINGEYWGIKNLRERYDKHYLERKYNVLENEIDLLSNVSEVDEGSSTYYNAVLDSLQNFHIDDLGGISFIERHIDMQNFTEYYASQIFFSNVDWPGTNSKYWRYTGPAQKEGRAKDGRFRWLMFDLDFGLGYLSTSGFDNDMFDHLLTDVQTLWSNPPESTLMFRSFVKNERFLEYYINVQMDLLNSYFKFDHTSKILLEFKQKLQNEIQSHIDRWGYPSSYASWESNIQMRMEFIERRPSHLISHLKEHFDTGEIVPIMIHDTPEKKGRVKINSIEITENLPGYSDNSIPWTGVYFSEIPVTLSAMPNAGYTFSEWRLNDRIYREPEITVLPTDSLNISAIFNEITDPEDQDLTLQYFWFFGTDLPNDTALERIDATYSKFDNRAYLIYNPSISPYPPESENDTRGIMDRVNDPTQINYRAQGNDNRTYEESDMRGIRVRNPSVVQQDQAVLESAVILDIPSVGLENLVLTFAAKRTNSGQEKMLFHYSVAKGEPVWIQNGLPVKSINTGENYEMFIIDFSGIGEHVNNEDFKFRISFDGHNIEENNGNTRFNNFAVFAKAFSGSNETEETVGPHMYSNYPNPFNHRTTIEYQIEEKSDISIDLYSITGQKIRRLIQEEKESGLYILSFDGSDLASGIYILRLQSGKNVDYQRITYIK